MSAARLDSLTQLIQANNLQEIQPIIFSLKEEKSWLWRHEPAVEHALRDAVMLGHRNIVTFLLDQGLHVNTTVQSADKGPYRRLIWFAVYAGHLSMVKLLIERGANVKPEEIRDQGDQAHGHDLVLEAVKRGHADIVECLLEQGAKADHIQPNLMWDPETSLLLQAVRQENKKMADALWKHGASVKCAIAHAYGAFLKDKKRLPNILHNDYSDRNRKDIISTAIFFSCVRQCSYQEIENFITNLHKDFSVVDNSHKESFLDRLHEFFTKYDIQFSSDQETKLIDTLSKFDQEKQQLTHKITQLESNYHKEIKALLDYAFGVDLTAEEKHDGKTYYGLTFLEKLNISNLNLIGLSINGRPLTRQMLQERDLDGTHAIVTQDDLEKLADAERRTVLTNRLKSAIQQHGKLIQEGSVNLVRLRVAAEIGDVRAVETRVAAGDDPNEALLSEHLAVIRIISKHPKIDKTLRIEAINHARLEKRDEIAQCLQESHDVNAQDDEQQTLLHKAARRDDLSDVQSLLAQRAEVNIADKAGATPLCLAVRSNFENSTAIVATLLEHKADANANKKIPCTPLNVAFRMGKLSAVELLLPLTQKTAIASEGMTKEKHSPWFVDMVFDALKHEEAFALLTQLKKHGADFNCTNQRGKTPLHWVIDSLPKFPDVEKEAESEALRSSYEHLLSTDTHARSWQPATQAYMAKHSDYFRYSRTKIEKYYRDTEIPEIQKTTRRLFELINFLLENGANPNALNAAGETALYAFIKKIDPQQLPEDKIKTIACFIKNGAEVNKPSQAGMTPLSLALQKADQAAIDTLKTNGAKLRPLSLALSKQGAREFHPKH